MSSRPDRTSLLATQSPPVRCACGLTSLCTSAWSLGPGISSNLARLVVVWDECRPTCHKAGKPLVYHCERLYRSRLRCVSQSISSNALHTSMVSCRSCDRTCSDDVTQPEDSVCIGRLGAPTLWHCMYDCSATFIFHNSLDPLED